MTAYTAPLHHKKTFLLGKQFFHSYVDFTVCAYVLGLKPKAKLMIKHIPESTETSLNLLVPS